MRRAAAEDLPAVMSLLDARTQWLRARDTDQWSTRAFQPVMEGAIERGETWLLCEDGQAVATLTMNTTADPDFWTHDEQTTPAFYLSKLATSLDHKGRGLGALLIDWAAGYACEHGILWLRWDVWRTNVELQNYYRSIGATPLRVVNIPGRYSGALFELSATPRADLGITTIAHTEQLPQT